jgi:hypothetical protein
MTAATWPVPQSRPSDVNLAGRLVALAVLGFGGLALTATALALSLVSGMIDRGVVVADARDVATVRAITPVIPLIAVFGVAHVIAAIGGTVGSKSFLRLGLGLGAVDVVAGILVMFGTALSAKPALDGAGIGVVIIILGTIVYAAIRAAEYDPANDPAIA